MSPAHALPLDVGSGTGEFAALFEPDKCLGVELKERYVRFASRLHPDHCFECADATTWLGRGGKFDLAFVNGVLHHHDPPTATRLLRVALFRSGVCSYFLMECRAFCARM